MNQVIELVLCHLFSHMLKFKNWQKLLSIIQKALNFIVFIITKVSSHELMYEFKLSTDLNLVMNILNSSFFSVHIDTQEVIAFAAMSMKKHYDKKHTSKFFSSDDKIILHLHKKYTISLTKKLEKKFTQQYADHFTVLKQVDCLVYELDLSQSWKIHLIISIVYLESVSKNDDLFNRHLNKLSLIIIKQNSVNENDSVSFY